MLTVCDSWSILSSISTRRERMPGQALKSLSPLFFSIFDEKLSHPWIQIKKKQLKFLRLSMGFDRKKIKILSFDRADLVPMTQGTKLRLIQSPMRLKLSCWRPRFKSWSPSWRPEFFEFCISYLDVFDN